MRAAPRPHSSDTSSAPLPVGAARAALVRLAIALAATVALLIVWRPTVVRAQGQPIAGKSAPAKPATQPPVARTTHVVQAGESLWSIALRYYGDGSAWTELARSNGIATGSARPVVVGMKLRVPATPPARAAGTPAPSTKPPADIAKAAVTAATAPRATPASTPATRQGGSSLATQTAGKSDAPAVAPRSASAKAAPSQAATSTVTRPNAKAPAVAERNPAAAADTTPSLLNPTTRAMRPQVKIETPIDRGAVRIGLLGPGDARAARSANEDATIFLRRIPSLEEAEATVRAAAPVTTVAPRRGEFDAAPFAIAPADLLKAGRIVRRVGSAAVGATDGGQRMLIADEVEVAPAAGTTLSVGDRLVALNRHVLLPNGLQVVVPGGVLQVTQTDAGKPAVAVVKSQSGLLEQGQPLVAVGDAPTAAGSPTSTDASDVKTTVAWVDNNSLLPTLQSFVILEAGSSQGVRPGDQFALVRARGSVNTGEEDRIAIVRVVRVGPNGSTAIVVKQEHAGIATGVTARRVARVP